MHEAGGVRPAPAHPRPTAARARDALEMATRDGARYAGIDAGVLEPGRLADLIVVDLERPHLLPLHDLESTLVYSARGSDVVVTIIDGEIVYQHGRCLRVDERSAMDETQQRADRLVARAGLRRPDPREEAAHAGD
ncbi:amidohydrolase family protein [Streptomyces sp. NPDC047725]|uniref:amidohydrolase family protein n=1 Tax=Streptomyces sp. NPDC047725 TaxID=3365487 RepID=UPI0037173BF7